MNVTVKQAFFIYRAGAECSQPLDELMQFIFTRLLHIHYPEKEINNIKQAYFIK